MGGAAPGGLQQLQVVGGLHLGGGRHPLGGPQSTRVCPRHQGHAAWGGTGTFLGDMGWDSGVDGVGEDILGGYGGALEVMGWGGTFGGGYGMGRDIWGCCGGTRGGFGGRQRRCGDSTLRERMWGDTGVPSWGGQWGAPRGSGGGGMGGHFGVDMGWGGTFGGDMRAEGGFTGWGCRT